jgi:hypothetical protein
VYDPWLGDFDPWVGRPSPSDSDGDQLGDEWEIAHFGSTEAMGGSDNPDGDLWTNRQEFQALTNPNNSNDFPRPTSVYVGFDGADDANLGSARYPLSTLHEAVKQINGLEEGHYFIHMAAGVYRLQPAGMEADERLTVHQNLTLIGSGTDPQGGTVLDGAGASTWTRALGFSPGASNVTVRGMIIENYGNEGFAFSTEGGCVSFEDVIIAGCGTGLRLIENYQSDFDLVGLTISACGIGVELRAGSSNNALRGVVVENSVQDGIRTDALFQRTTRLAWAMAESPCLQGVLQYG